MVRNSPWAMLMTPIWPKMIASPRAISSSTLKKDRPLKPCITSRDPISESVIPSIALTPVGSQVETGRAWPADRRVRGLALVAYW